MKPSGRLRTVFCLLLAAALGWALTLAVLLVSHRGSVLETVPDLPVMAESSESPPRPPLVTRDEPAAPAVPVVAEGLDLTAADTCGTQVLPPLPIDVPAPFDLAAAPATETGSRAAPDDSTAATPSLPVIVPVSATEEVVSPSTPALEVERLPAATPAASEPAPAGPQPAAEESVSAGVPLIPLPAARRREASPVPLPEPVQPAPAVEPIIAPSASDGAPSAAPAVEAPSAGAPSAAPAPAVEPQPEPSASREPEAEAAEAAVTSDEETAADQPDGAADGAHAASRGEGDAAGATEPAGVECGEVCAARPGGLGRLWDFLTYRPLRTPGWRNCCKVRSSCCRPPLYYYFLDSGCGAMGCMFWNQPACNATAVPLVAP